MHIEKHKIEEHNRGLLAQHKRRLDFNAGEINNVDDALEKLQAFNIAIPSWALGTGGTRFGRFPEGGEPRILEELIEDVVLIHAVNRSSYSISFHIPWV